jgi:hypothetical protein
MSDNVETTNARRWLALLVALWAGLTLVRWLAALPITEPRIFQDELLHWQMAKEIARHQPFLLFGRSVDTPAVLYPAILSIVFQATDARMAFDLARGVNAALLCAVVFLLMASLGSSPHRPSPSRQPRLQPWCPEASFPRSSWRKASTTRFSCCPAGCVFDF